MSRPIPDAILNAPDLEMGLGLYQSAFWDLDTCRRNNDTSKGPIPWTAIFTYCEQYHIEGDQRDDMFYHISEMDHAYLDFHAPKD